MTASARLLIDTLDGATFDIAAIEGRERLSAPYRFDVTATARGGDEGPLPRRALGRRARLRVEVHGITRTFCGVVAQIHTLGRVTDATARDASRPLYRIRVACGSWLLRHRVTSRIFQDVSVPDVLRAVLAEHRIGARFELERGYPAREYITQYRETDLAFLQRLMAEAGLFYRAAPAADGAAFVDDLVFGDTPYAYENLSLTASIGPRPATLFFLDVHGTSASGADKVHAFTLRSAIRASAAAHRDFDPERPRTPLTASAAIEEPPLLLEAYDHGSDFLFPKWGAAEENFGDEGARRALEQHRRRAVVASGRSSCLALGPGRRFALEAHPLPELDREWTAVEVRHHLDLSPDDRVGVRYENRFACVPSDVAYPPLRPSRRPMHVAETGTVVGPPGEEIHVDARARIKVHLHWDRRGPSESSSCWLRTMQTASGPGWGSQFIPRVGMEVVVLFEGGDPDRPLVIGTVNNALNPPPYRLPEYKTKSGYKSRSTPRAEGFNEISFEDAAGQEALSIHAQRDLHEAIGNDRSAIIGRDRDTTIQGSSREVVRGSSLRAVGGDESVRVAGVSTLEIDGAREERTKGDMRAAAGGDRVLEIAGDDRSEVGGDRTATVRGSDHVVAAVARSVIVGTPDERRGDALTHVWGRSTQRTTGITEVVGDEGIVLRSGKSTIEILPDRVRIHAPVIETVADDAVSMRGDGERGPVLRLSARAEILAEEIHLRTASARLSLKHNASLRGDKVLLNSDEAQLEDQSPNQDRPETRRLALRLFDEARAPYADKPYSLLVGSATFEGKTDAEGRLSAIVPAEAKTGRLVLWKDAYPTGPTEEWTLQLDTVGPADSPRELQKRLGNLGYPSGPPTEELTPRLREALQAFQSAHALAATGEPDEATLALLHRIHP